jgi:hypothetical protein
MLRLLITLVGLVAAVSLVPAAPVPTHLRPKEPLLFHPVQKGARWVYEQNGREYTCVITASEENAKTGMTTVTISQEGPNGTFTQLKKVAVGSSGVLWLENTAGPFDEPYWLLKSPVRERDEWTFRTSGPGIANMKGTMRAAKVEEVEVPAGKFSAVRIEQEATFLTNGEPDGGFCQTFWFAPGIGLVKWTCGDAESGLKSFVPGK